MEFDENIIVNNGVCKINPDLSQDMLDAMNFAIAEGFCRNGDIEDGMKLYNTILDKNPKLKDEISENFTAMIRLLALELFKKKKYTNAIIQYKRLSKLTKLTASDLLNTAKCLSELGQNQAAAKFLDIYSKSEENKKSAYGNCAEILGLKLKMYKEAIVFMEKYIDIEPKNALAYNTLGHFYAELYNDKFLEKQMECFLKANELNPNNQIYIRNVIFAGEKLKNFETTEKFYKKLLKLNPTELDLNYYGCFLINKGNLKEGYKYLESRFFAPEVILEYPKWLDLKKRLTPEINLKDKTVLIFHEGGYGDSIMYVRFIKQLTQNAEKVLLFVPEKLISLFKSSDINVEMHSMTEDLTKFDYDYNATLVDLPYILQTTPETIPQKEGYLKVSDEKISQYSSNLSKNKKFKIGISYCANPKYKNATKRDIPLETFYPLTKLNAEIYSLQVSDEKNQIQNLPKDIKIINLGNTFKTFEDSAAAISNMDLIITTDNVILNLSGALGVKTFALFNRFPEYRWFETEGNDVCWYKSVKPYVAKSFNDWEDLMKDVIIDTNKLIEHK